jgi:hypothetical protein
MLPELLEFTPCFAAGGGPRHCSGRSAARQQQLALQVDLAVAA